MSNTPIHRVLNGNWKWVEALQPIFVVFLTIIQALVVYIWTQHIDSFQEYVVKSTEYSTHVEERVDELELFRAETQANRFTSQDALRMNQLLLESLHDMETELKRCIRTQDC